MNDTSVFHMPWGDYCEDMKTLIIENGITGGLTPTTFGPNASCTRAQVVTFLYAYKTK